jgi:hypothetical protein
MATKATASPSEQISSSFQRLAESAAELNAASDELAQAVEPIDAALRSLNLGIPTWYRYESSEDEAGYFRSLHVGYAKVSGKWGLALSEVTGNENYGIDSESEWLFNDAPRFMRLEAIDHLPRLLDALVDAVSKATASLRAKTSQAREFAGTMAAMSKMKSGRR